MEGDHGEVSRPRSHRKLIKETIRFAPEDLLPALAREGATQTLRHREDPHKLLDGGDPKTPWAVIGIAREVLVHAKNDGQRPPRRQDIHRLCGLYADLDDPLTTEAGTLERFLVRILHEQSRWQLSEFEELSRPHALYIEAASALPNATAFAPAAWEAALGCTLEQFVATGFFAFVGASQHEGWFDPSWLSQPNFDVLEEHLGLTDPQVLGLLDRHFAVTPAEFREMDRDPAGFRGVEEHRFNPLTARPMLKMRNGKYLAAQPLLILHCLSCNGLYYDRVREPGFTDQLGPVFEHYVGMHLELLQRATVIHSIRQANGEEVIDYVVVLADVVLLIEIKATRLTEEARAGLDKLDDDVARTIGKAQIQINTANQMIDDGDPAFAFVPTDLPRRRSHRDPGALLGGALRIRRAAHASRPDDHRPDPRDRVPRIRGRTRRSGAAHPRRRALQQCTPPGHREPLARSEPDPRPSMDGNAPGRPRR